MQVVKNGLWVLVIIAMTTGCATSANNAGDVRAIKGVLAQWKEAVLADDLGRVLALYSEDARNSGTGKSGLAVEMKSVLDRVKKDDGRIDVEDATITVKGVRASVLPVSIGTRTGAITRRLNLEKKNGRWRIVAMPRT